MTEKRTKAERQLLMERSTRLAALQLLYSEAFQGQKAHSDAFLSEDQECAASDKVFLASLLSCARARRKDFIALFRVRIENRAWENIDLLLRLVLILGAAEILLFEQDLSQQSSSSAKVKGRRGRLVGEYCGLAALFYEEAHVIGLINAVLDRLASDGVAKSLQKGGEGGA